MKHLNQQLNDAQDEDTLRNVLNVLETQFISLEMMEKTLIGVSLTRVQRRVESGRKRNGVITCMTFVLDRYTQRTSQ